MKRKSKDKFLQGLIKHTSFFCLFFALKSSREKMYFENKVISLAAEIGFYIMNFTNPRPRFHSVFCV